MQVSILHIRGDLLFEPDVQQNLVLVANQSEVVHSSLRLENTGDAPSDVRLQAQCDVNLRYSVLICAFPHSKQFSSQSALVQTRHISICMQQSSPEFVDDTIKSECNSCCFSSTGAGH